MSKKYLITSALLYANGPVHFGHIAGAYLPGDVFARFQRMQGNEVLYLSGSDEYGVPITLSAELAKRTPKEHVDLFHEINSNLFQKMNFSFDHFARTTWEGHNETVVQFFEDLNKNGFIEEKVEDHLYSEKEDRFLADRYVMGECPKCGFQEARGDECQSCGASYEAKDLKNPLSKLTKAPLTLKKSKHWYLKFEQFKEKLEEYIVSKKWKSHVAKFAMSYVENLHARAITRDSKWGVPLPLKDTDGKVFYVWFDAPIGYISAAKEWAQKTGDPDKWKSFWLDDETTFINFIGKDNIPFHTVFFPAMTMGQDTPYKLVDMVSANEFLLLEGKQFSKSDGWYIDLEDFFKRYSSDQIRYALAANAPETADSDFSWKDFQMRCNAELLGKLGNFVHRTLIFAKKSCNQVVPTRRELKESDKKFLKDCGLAIENFKYALESFSLRKTCQHLCELASVGNVYFDYKKPWQLAKEGQTEDLETTINLCLECIKNLAVVSSPLIPDAAQKIWQTLGKEGELSKANANEKIQEPLKEGQKLGDSLPLFKRIEDEEIEAEIAKLGVPKKNGREKDYPTLKNKISFDDFQSLDLRVAEIISAEKVPKSKRLLKLLIDVGFEKRTIVSGIAEKYNPDDLTRKKVVVVANLKPAKIMGIESQGMILAATLNKDLELPFIQDMKPGSVVS